MKKKLLMVGLMLALIVSLAIPSVALAEPDWKTVTYTYPEVDIPLDYNNDGVVDNLYTVALSSIGDIYVMYYRPGESWKTGFTIVGTESWTEIGKGKKAEWKAIDCFPYPDYDAYTHPLIQEKM